MENYIITSTSNPIQDSYKLVTIYYSTTALTNLYVCTINPQDCVRCVIKTQCLSTEDVILLVGTVKDLYIVLVTHFIAVELFSVLHVTMSVNAHLAVQRNAFSTAAAAAKVCDGLVSSSIGERQSFAGSYNSQYGEQIFLLVPSITNHVHVFSQQPKGSPPAADWTAYPTWSVHSFDDIASGGVIKKTGSPDQYRLVSAGMRLAPINASESNQGWFEAVRVRPSWSKDSFLFQTGGPDISHISPGRETFEGGLIGSFNWANDPSYVTGRLRDLGKHTFYLQPTGPRRFKKWPENVLTNSFETFEEQPLGFDTDFDMIIVRIHSAPAPATSNTLFQSIHVHVVKNWETLYDATNPNARFHSATISAESAVRYTDKQLTRDPKASMIRSASSYAYKF